jgi:hypothetical protein
LVERKGSIGIKITAPNLGEEMKDMVFFLIVMGCIFVYFVYQFVTEDVRRKQYQQEAKKKRELIRKQENTDGAGI